MFTIRSLFTVLSIGYLAIAHPIFSISAEPEFSDLVARTDLATYLQNCINTKCFATHQKHDDDTSATIIDAFTDNKPVAQLQISMGNLKLYAKAYLRYLGKENTNNFIVAAVHKAGTGKVYLHSIPRGKSARVIEQYTPPVLRTEMMKHLVKDSNPDEVWHHAETAAMLLALKGNNDRQQGKETFQLQYYLAIAGKFADGKEATMCNKCRAVFQALDVIHPRMNEMI